MPAAPENFRVTVFGFKPWISPRRAMEDHGGPRAQHNI